ncbi:MAG: DUF262 domain-containing protein [Bacteroidales bacterium]|nr:DUF262 domain-containing protein [Bacteroidales bacterium]
MEIEVSYWTINDLINNKDYINPKPQYQRTSVWSPQKKKLLIDSILRGYDLPKFYIRETPLDQNYRYEVTDGQQRMRAIWEFVDDVEAYSLDDSFINGVNTKGLTYNDFKRNYPELQRALLNFKLHIAIIKSASSEETRTLFARLQMGEKLNPVELRNAMTSNIGNAIQSLTINSKFFDKECKIKNSRFKHQDYLDHVITLIHFNGQRNLKSMDIKQLYLELANETLDKFQPMLGNVNKVLDLMRRINSHRKGIFRNKWTFVDAFYLLFTKIDSFIDIKPKILADNLANFESKRRKYNKDPEKLIEDKTKLSYDKDMYDYIIAFKSAGAEKNNIKIRHRVFVNHFFKSDNFTIR